TSLVDQNPAVRGAAENRVGDQVKAHWNGLEGAYQPQQQCRRRPFARYSDPAARLARRAGHQQGPHSKAGCAAGAQQSVFSADVAESCDRDLGHVEFTSLGATVQRFDVIEREIVTRRHRAEYEGVVWAGRYG